VLSGRSKPPYHDENREGGSASAKTVYLVRIPEDHYLSVKHFAATIYTTNPGDYTTAKFIYLGYDLAGVKYYLEGHDVQSGSGKNPGVVSVKNVDLPATARPLAYFEATSTSQKYAIMIGGTLVRLNQEKE